MIRFHAVMTCAALAAAALAAGGCSAAQNSSAGDFQGAERDVAQVVDELQSAGRSKNAEKICNEILSPRLVEQLKSGGSNCVDEMDDAIKDSDDFDLVVRDVTVTGDTARAQVRQGDDGPTATFAFAKERGGWRATSLGGS